MDEHTRVSRALSAPGPFDLNTVRNNLVNSLPRRNLELKARDPDPARSLRICGDLGAQDRGTLIQRDTCFDPAELRAALEGGAGDGEDPNHFTALLDSLRSSFATRDEDLLRESYSDLIRAARP